MPVHPDKTAYRAVDACGGAYTPEEVARGWAAGHKTALDAACEAVAKPYALMNELLEALQEIADAHLPSQPAASGLDDLSWAMRHIGRLRGIAMAAVAKAESPLIPSDALQAVVASRVGR